MFYAFCCSSFMFLFRSRSHDPISLFLFSSFQFFPILFPFVYLAPSGWLRMLCSMLNQ